MKVIKIDPSTQTIEFVETTGKLNSLRSLINCRLIDVCARQDNGDSLTVDDEALYLEPQPNAFRFGNYGHPIHGVALLTGTTEDGSTAEPVTTIEEARALVEWMGDVYTAPSVTVFPQYDIVLLPGTSLN